MARSRTNRGPSEAGGPGKRPLPARILLATDGSDDAVLAMRAAADLSRRSGAELHLVHAWHAEIPGAHVLTMPGARADWCEQKAGELLAREAERLEGFGGRAGGAHLKEGRAAEEISVLAREIGAGLVVLGSRGLGPVGRLVLGSVSGGVVRNAPCPVLLLRGGPTAWPPGRVVVGTDFSEGSMEASRLAAGIGGLYGARLLLVHAYPALELAHKTRASGAVSTDREVRAAHEALGWLSAELERTLDQRPERRTLVGDAADCVLEAAGGTGNRPSWRSAPESSGRWNA